MFLDAPEFGSFIFPETTRYFGLADMESFTPGSIPRNFIKTISHYALICLAELSS